MWFVVEALKHHPTDHLSPGGQLSDKAGFIPAEGFAVGCKQVVEPDFGLGAAAVLDEQSFWPREVGLCPAPDKTPLETTDAARLEERKLVVDAAADGSGHPFGAIERAVEPGQMVDDPGDVFGVAVGVERDDVGKIDRDTIGFGREGCGIGVELSGLPGAGDLPARPLCGGPVSRYGSSSQPVGPCQ